jgi:hypothetical protein
MSRVRESREVVMWPALAEITRPVSGYKLIRLATTSFAERLAAVVMRARMVSAIASRSASVSDVLVDEEAGVQAAGEASASASTMIVARMRGVADSSRSMGGRGEVGDIMRGRCASPRVDAIVR